MIQPEKFINENERLKLLESYSILDTLPEIDYDNLTAIAAAICGTPISLISLLDDKRQWFKSHHGLNVSETPKEYAFCAHAINDSNNIFIIQDSRKDERFINNPLVTGEPYVIFYAGVPLISPNGLPLGTLCVIDHEPKLLSNGQITALKALSKQVINLLELRKNKMQLEQAIEVIKQTNLDLEKSIKLAEESVILKETFLANMSHEIRTPMNAIIGFTDLLLKRNLQDQERDFVQIIKISGENLLRIINDILDISKIDSGMMSFEERPISIRELFGSLSTMLSQKAKEKDLNLTFECDHSLPEVMLGDLTRLTQIIINLAGNSIKFTKKGSVYIFAKILKEESEIYHVEFSVKDTGIGIPENKLQHVFVRFRQAESHTTRNYGGTGLGLSIAKQMVELQGGEITLKSMEGVGSVFSFTLPFKKTNQIISNIQQSHIEFNIHELSKLDILIAEDNPINIKFVLSLFADYNIKADIAENGKLALEMAKNKNYDLILMDIEMPEMNGYETTKFIRKDLKSDIPIIAMTANAMAGEKEKCLELGMNDYISKPINAELLFEKMIVATASKTNNENNKNEKIVNLDFLVKSMRGKKEVIRDTIDVFLQQTPEDISAINEAVTNTDFLSIKNSSHRMKSTVSLMGISVMEKILDEMETLASSKNEMKRIKELNDSLNKLSEQAILEMEVEKLKYS